MRSGTHMSMQEAALILRQMLRAIVSCNEHQFVHRDLKPENFMIKDVEKQGVDSSIKLIDLGWAAKFNSGVEKGLAEEAGRVAYMAPEVLDHQYGRKCDVWSLGVIFYLLLTTDTLYDLSQPPN